MKHRLPVLLLGLTALTLHAAPLYEENFEKTQGEGLPESLLLLDGQFAVKGEAGNRYLELPGSPLETYGVLFGPNLPHGTQAEARILATKAGRKFPTFALGLNGVNGFKLRVVPGKNQVELVQGEEVKASAPFPWQSGEWTSLKLQVKADGAGLSVAAKAWQGATEPANWTVQLAVATPLPAGKAGVWGMPFSGTPLRFDNFRVVTPE
jgi:hypothetical protein